MIEEELGHILDANLGLDMAFYAELASKASSVELLPGSELYIQGQHYQQEQQHLNPVYLAWRGIASAGEHMGFAEYMRYATSGGVIERPHASLARTALLGAARAVYVLAPDEPNERAVRAARVANAEAEDARRMIDNWESQIDPDGFIDELEEYSKDIAKDAAKILTAAGEKSTTKIKETELLCAAVAELPITPPDCVEQTLTLWNRFSGVAHSRSWTWNLQSGVIPREDFVGVWFIPVVMLCYAWRLWNMRRGAESQPHQAPDGWETDRSRWGQLPS